MEGIHEDHPKTKYIYVSGHSKLTPDMDYIGPFEQIQFVNLVEPDTLSFETPEASRAIEIFSKLDDDTRERVLKSFLKDFRFFRTRPDLRHNFVSTNPYILDKVSNQTFSFGKEEGLMQGIWDLDEVREDPELFKTPSIFGRVLSDGESVKHNIAEIIDMTKKRYPRHPLFFILTGCRVFVTPEIAKQIEEVRGDPEAFRKLALGLERNPDETTAAALGEAVVALNIAAGKDDGPDKMEDDSDEVEEKTQQENAALWDSLMYPPDSMEGIKGGYRRRHGRLSKRKSKKKGKTKGNSKTKRKGKSKTKKHVKKAKSRGKRQRR